MAASRQRTWFDWRLIPIAAALLAALGLYAWRDRPTAAKPGNVIAVLPFKLGVADSSLSYMREGMSILLENRLNGDHALGDERLASDRSR
jgi:hypothetical protein